MAGDAPPKEVEALSDRQLRQFRGVFSSFDPSATGFLLRQDAAQAMHALGLFPADAELRRLLDEGGGAGGRVDFMQFCAIVARQLGAVRTAPALVRAFAAFDRLGQGYVSAQEFRDIFERVGEIPCAPETADEMLAFADPGETGQVYYEPFVARLFAGVKEAKDAKEAALKK
jgi:Ca2+-binding EF-hand superfamily protein